MHEVGQFAQSSVVITEHHGAVFPSLGPSVPEPEQLRQYGIVQQLAPRIAPQRLRIAVSGHVHDLRGRRAGHIGRRHESPPQTMGANGVDLAGRRRERAASPLRPPAVPRSGSRAAPRAARKRRTAGPSSARGWPATLPAPPPRTARTRAAARRRTAPLWSVLLLRIVTMRKPGRPKSRSSTLSAATSARRRPEANVREFERRREPLRRDGGAAVIAAGVFAPGALEQVADHPLVGRRRQPPLEMKEPDGRCPRAERLGRCAAVAQRSQERRDERRMGPKGFLPEAVGVRLELPPARLIRPLGVGRFGAGDEAAGGGDRTRDCWGRQRAERRSCVRGFGSVGSGPYGVDNPLYQHHCEIEK
jgi:hypothetical protein